jgi:hypothetical protein
MCPYFRRYKARRTVGGTQVLQENTTVGLSETSNWIAELMSAPMLAWEDFSNDPKVRRRVGELLSSPRPRKKQAGVRRRRIGA